MARVLLIGGLDSSCGAGLVRDAATVMAAGHQPIVCATAVTAQGGQGVTAIHPVPAEVIAAQITEADAVKIGMLCDETTVHAVAEALSNFHMTIVLDPVIAASSGGRLLSDNGIRAMLDLLLPKVTLITPNLPELRILADFCGTATGSTSDLARTLLQRGAANVLVKGGHDTGPEATDILYGPATPIHLTGPRHSGNPRGTGCTMASAIACALAEGAALLDACARGKQAVSRLFAAAG
ncbi:hydroxymethylpyrimidine/phosphomethylpyrimidine kinase [Donghicola sp. C2-DW-16]|uniref:hydroxymethylpyrimidine kinase n=1 Tax=Donghicola mangrovi TaxID=2729614 RepID=A0ABX2PFE8_9RHOB|nr:hydroxymethylpyrimidine/phosphomethylpyrimidine kinase [Donghicola mangrovi]NVO28208.1 hydroxymethylpyrimidine/phosphomethylpyrimidine kinase [Donghicola mangrovi]